MSTVANEQEQGVGLECRKCGCRHNKVVYTRHIRYTTRGGPVTITKRCRECRHCLNRYYSTERLNEGD
jgi:hypothetical protein